MSEALEAGTVPELILPIPAVRQLIMTTMAFSPMFPPMAFRAYPLMQELPMLHRLYPTVSFCLSASRHPVNVLAEPITIFTI